MGDDNLGKIIQAGQKGEWDKIRGDNAHSALDLSEISLGGHCNLKGWEFWNINFDKANFEKLRIGGASFKNCSFNGATLRNFSLTSVEMIDCDFQGAKLSHIVFNGMQNIRGVNFSGANFNSCDFSNSKLNNINFKEATFNAGGNSFNTSQIEECCFDATNLTGVPFEQAVLGGVTFNGRADLTGTNFSRCILKKGKETKSIEFKDATCKSANFQSVDIERTVFIGADLEGAKFNSAQVQLSNFSGANLNKTNFNDANLTGADLSNSSLKESIMTSCKLIDVDLSGVNMYSASLGLTDWSGTKIDADTNLELSKFENHVFTNDNSDKIVLSKLDKFINWGKIRTLGQFPVFGISWLACTLSIVLVNSIAFLNQSEFIQTIDYPIGYPSGMVHIILSTVFLVVGSTYYKILCPETVQEFSEAKWVYERKFARVLYLHDCLKHPAHRKLCAFFLYSGALYVGVVILIRLVEALRNILEYIF